jgi:hypothetical protein
MAEQLSRDPTNATVLQDVEPVAAEQWKRGHQRLMRRLVALARQLSRAAQFSFPQSLDGSEFKGAKGEIHV